MPGGPDIRSQLRTLSIPKDSRPGVERPAGAARRRRWLIAVAAVAALLLVFYLGGGRIASPLGQPTAKASELRLSTVSRRDPSQPIPVLTATGKIVSDHTVEVATKVSGQVVSLHFEQGDRVEAGQVLAGIEDVTYRALRDQAAADLEKSKANLAYQEINYKRVTELHDKANAPDIELAEARRAHDEAMAQVTAGQAALDYAQKALTDCRVLAPITGVVLLRNVEVGDFVAAEGGLGANANAQLGTIADMTKLRVEVDISELDIARLCKDMACVVTPDAYKDRRYTGRVMWIDPGANYSKATVQVKVRIDYPDAFLRVDGSAQVAFVSEAADGTAAGGSGIWIPISACRKGADAGEAQVFVAEGGRLRLSPVKLGRRAGSQVEVLSGLTEGQSIAAEGVETLSDGQRLRR